MEDDEDFLAAVEADNASNAEDAKTLKVEADKVEVVEQAPAETPQPEQPGGEPATEAPKDELLLDTPVEAPKQPEPGFVPIAAMLDARDRAKAAEERLRQLEEQARQAQQQVPMPDPYEDPEGFAAAQQAQVGQALYQTNLRWSERIASIQHGADTVAKAKEWGFAKCDSDPYFNARVAASDDPIGFVVEQWKREELVSQVQPDEFEQFRAWKAAQAQLQTQPPAQAGQPNTASKIPPRSLASAPSAGSILIEPEPSDEDIFKEVIGKR